MKKNRITSTSTRFPAATLNWYSQGVEALKGYPGEVMNCPSVQGPDEQTALLAKMVLKWFITFTDLRVLHRLVL